MPTPLDYLGLNSDTGLGIVSQGLRSQDLMDQKTQQNLADLYLKQQQGQGAGIANQTAQLGLDEARQLSPSNVAAKQSDNTTKVSNNQITQQQNLYQNVRDYGDLLNNVPPEQRHDQLIQMGDQIPGIKASPVYQQLLNTSPEMLPTALKQVGTQGLLNTGDQLRKMQSDKQVQDAAMARTQVSEAGANSRNASSNATQLQATGMNNAAAMARQQATEDSASTRQDAALKNARDINDANLAAGKYNRGKAATTLAGALKGAKTYQQASLLYGQQADEAAANGDTEYAAQLNQKAQEMAMRDYQARQATFRPGSTIDNGNIVPTTAPAPTAPAYGGVQQRSEAPQANAPVVGAMYQGKKITRTGTNGSGQRVVKFEDGSTAVVQ